MSEAVSSSDITLHEEDDVPVPSYRRDSLTAWSDQGNDAVSPSVFPFHLISGCSAAERAMCQYSESITSQMVQGRMGWKGTLTWRWRCGSRDPHQIFGRRVSGGGGPLDVPSWPHANCLQHHATCGNSPDDTGQSRADSANDSSSVGPSCCEQQWRGEARCNNKQDTNACAPHEA